MPLKIAGFKAALAVATLAMFTSPQLASAAAISGSLTGLASPAVTITFDEHVLNTNDLVTNQYADVGLTFSPYLKYSPQTGFPNISGHDVGNFSPGPDPLQFSLNFLTNQTQVAFAMVSNNSPWSFEALLGNSVVESFNASVGVTANDFYGFTGITFDQIRITTQGDFMLIDNIQLGAGTTDIPEPASLALLGAALAGFGMTRRRGKAA